MKTYPVMYLDFDGVFNYDGSRNGYKKRSGGLGYQYRTTALGFPLKWSGELVYKLAELPAEWVWLSSWSDSKTMLDYALNVETAEALLWVEENPFNNDSGKYDALLADQRTKPRPFVWVDDVATVHFNANDLYTPVPHLVLTPNEATGMTMDDYFKVKNFLLSN